ncbi:Astrotactin-1 [Manis pentadactyla]|nr:Astrotactin-1 [Manis pentadactyla]
MDKKPKEIVLGTVVKHKEHLTGIIMSLMMQDSALSPANRREIFIAFESEDKGHSPSSRARQERNRRLRSFKTSTGTREACQSRECPCPCPLRWKIFSPVALDFFDDDDDEDYDDVGETDDYYQQ